MKMREWLKLNGDMYLLCRNGRMRKTKFTMKNVDKFVDIFAVHVYTDFTLS